MERVALCNLGCKVNAYELDAMKKMLENSGYEIVPFDGIADIYIVNTCTVTNIADRKSRQMLHRARKRNPQAVVVAAGCYIQAGDEACLDASIDLAIGNNKKKDLIPILETFLKQRKEGGADQTLGHTTIPDLRRPVPYEEMTLEGCAGHTRAFVKIQDGCDQFCSYCVIPLARGRVRSRRPEQVYREAQALAKSGYQEIVLTGIHLSSYGMDLVKADGRTGRSREEIRRETYEQAYLLRLIEDLHEISGLKRIRLGSLEPRIITDAFARRLQELPKVCPHFHLSLQSGCDTTLKRMNRHYQAGEYYEKVNLLREVFEDPAITTDVIVGFPGETAEEFAHTLAFLEKTEFFEMHVFPYSRRKGTVAAKMPDQVPDQIKTERSRILLKLAEQQSRRYRERLIGKEKEILLEEPIIIEGKSYLTGHTREYVKTAVFAGENTPNQLMRGKITGFLQENMVLMQ